MSRCICVCYPNNRKIILFANLKIVHSKYGRVSPSEGGLGGSNFHPVFGYFTQIVPLPQIDPTWETLYGYPAQEVLEVMTFSLVPLPST